MGDRRLRIRGLVDRPVELPFEDLLSHWQVSAAAPLTCVSDHVGGELVDNTTPPGSAYPLADLLARRRAGRRGRGGWWTSR